RRVEAVVLNDDCGARLSCVGAPRSDRPDLAAPHSWASQDTASMNAWSSAACSLAATAADWRCASRMNSGARVSGTQIWTGLNPWALRRSRWACTLLADDRSVAIGHTGYM